jgi:enamine deaminase RidA (YjgF/YER057c/UK114 family)
VARQRVASGAPYEERYGYSRAIMVGSRISVSGTAPIWPDGHVDPDPGVQARRCFEIILAALAEVGAGPEHGVRTRMYITDPSISEVVGLAHGEVFKDIRPATSMIVVTQLIDPRWLLEIEAEAVLETLTHD